MFRRTYTAVGPTYSTSVFNCLKVLGAWECPLALPGGACPPWDSPSLPSPIHCDHGRCLALLRGETCPLGTPEVHGTGMLDAMGRAQSSGYHRTWHLQCPVPAAPLHCGSGELGSQHVP